MTQDNSFSKLTNLLAQQIDTHRDHKKYATTKQVLTLVATGLFLGSSLVIPNLPAITKYFIKKQKQQEYEIWKRFNIPYLKRILQRLEEQKLIEISDQNNMQVVTITENGKKKILKHAIDTLTIEKPTVWDRTWHLVSYDIPTEQRHIRHIFYEYLHAWHFYPLHESVLLHAFPCEKQVEFLKNYLGIGKYVRMVTVSHIENDKPFRDFFSI